MWDKIIIRNANITRKDSSDLTLKKFRTVFAAINIRNSNEAEWTPAELMNQRGTTAYRLGSFFFGRYIITKKRYAVSERMS